MSSRRFNEESGEVSMRCRRVAESIRETTSKIVTSDLADPRIGFITVTKTSITSDLKVATVYVSVLGPEADRTKAMAALKHAAGFIKRRCGDQLQLRYTPEIRFEFDDGIDKQLRVSELLHEGKQDDPNDRLPVDAEEPQQDC
jgi:ribosome-binding factor A